jgi:hypothetical protein
MPIGFQSYTDDGILQIDAEKKCYVLKQAAKGTSGANRLFVLRIPLGINPLVFFHDSDGALVSNYVSGTQRTYVFYSNSPNQDVRWYHYDVISTNVGAGFGFQLFNSAGEITFDAAQRPLVLYAAVAGVKPTSGATLSINAARDYAVNMPTVPLHSRLPRRGNNFNYFTTRPTRSGSTLTFSLWNYLGFAGWGAFEYDMEATTALVTDVTGIATPVWAPLIPPSSYWQIIEGSFGDSYGFHFAPAPYGSISGATTFGGANIKAISQSRALIQGNPFVTFSVGMSGNRGIGFWTSLNVSGYGYIYSSQASRSYNAGTNTTTWGFNGIDVSSIDGFGVTEGVFT